MRNRPPHRRRPKIRLVNVLTLLLVTMALATAGLWVWSYSCCAALAHSSGGTTATVWRLYSWRGSIHIWHTTAIRVPPWPTSPPRSTFETSPRATHDTTLISSPSRAQFLGVVLASHDLRRSGTLSGVGPYTMRDHFHGVVLPYWLVIILLLALPSVGLGRRLVRHLRRPADGYCTRCGYDLEGNLSGICPECGEPRPTPGAAR